MALARSGDPAQPSGSGSSILRSDLLKVGPRPPSSSRSAPVPQAPLTASRGSTSLPKAIGWSIAFVIPHLLLASLLG
jgi:hypothetical protein